MADHQNKGERALRTRVGGKLVWFIQISQSAHIYCQSTVGACPKVSILATLR